MEIRPACYFRSGPSLASTVVVTMARMDEDQGNTDDALQANKESPRDGSIDFTAYSIEQLRELQFSIDPKAFPENFRRLVAALKQKEEPIIQPLPPGETVVGR